jgi:hypothetical protein
VIVTQQMKKAVDQEPVHSALGRLSRLPGLGKGGVHGDDHISEHACGGRRGRSGEHGECQDVGRAMSFEVLLIELGNPLVIREKDAQLRLTTAQVF